MFSTKSSKPTVERSSTRRRFNRLVDHEVAIRLKDKKHRYSSDSDSDSDSRLSEALRLGRSSRRSRHSSRHSRHSSRHSSRRSSRDDERIRRLKKELARLDQRYSSASESEGKTADLQRVVSKLEVRFNQARQELASVLATKAARHAAHGNASQDQISAAIKAALATAGVAAPGLSAIAPATPYALQYAALTAAAQQAILQNPNATGIERAQLEITLRNAQAAEARAMMEGAENARRYHLINAENDAIVQANIDSTKEHISNVGKGLYGAVGAIYNPLAAIVNKGKALAARTVQY